jgi:hypothetical protein
MLCLRSFRNPDTEPPCVSMRAGPSGEDRMLTHGGSVACRTARRAATEPRASASGFVAQPFLAVFRGSLASHYSQGRKTQARMPVLQSCIL